MKNTSYFSTLSPEQKRVLRLQGACNRENVTNARREQKRESRTNGAIERVRSHWRDANSTKIKIDLRKY
jgi:hypothetical protein